MSDTSHKDSVGRNFVEWTRDCKITKLDWDVIEAFALTHRYGAQDQISALCGMLVAVRDHVIESVSNAPPIPKGKDPKK